MIDHELILQEEISNLIPSRYLVLSDLNIPLIFPHIPSLIFLTKITLIKSHNRLWLLPLSLKPLIIGPHIFFFIFSCLIPTMYLYTLQAFETNCFLGAFFGECRINIFEAEVCRLCPRRKTERIKHRNLISLS